MKRFCLLGLALLLSSCGSDSQYDTIVRPGYEKVLSEIREIHDLKDNPRVSLCEYVIYDGTLDYDESGYAVAYDIIYQLSSDAEKSEDYYLYHAKEDAVTSIAKTRYWPQSMPSAPERRTGKSPGSGSCKRQFH